MMPVKILLFSADDSMGQKITSCLVEAGYRVIRQIDGLQALERIVAEKPALVILDMDLPGYNSLAIIRALRAAEYQNRTPVILVGTNLRDEDVLIGLEVGADLCLLEQFHPQVFLARVRSLVRRTEMPNPKFTMLR